MKQEAVLPDGWYLVRCTQVLPYTGVDFSRGITVRFGRIIDGQGYTYYLPRRNNSENAYDCGLAMRNLCHGFDYPFEIGQPYDYKRLIDRHAEILIRHELRDGRLVPIIMQFRQSPVQWFKWKGNGDGK